MHDNPPKQKFSNKCSKSMIQKPQLKIQEVDFHSAQKYGNQERIFKVLEFVSPSPIPPMHGPKYYGSLSLSTWDIWVVHVSYHFK